MQQVEMKSKGGTATIMRLSLSSSWADIITFAVHIRYVCAKDGLCQRAAVPGSANTTSTTYPGVGRGVGAASLEAKGSPVELSHLLPSTQQHQVTVYPCNLSRT